MQNGFKLNPVVLRQENAAAVENADHNTLDLRFARILRFALVEQLADFFFALSLQPRPRKWQSSFPVFAETTALSPQCVRHFSAPVPLVLARFYDDCFYF